MNKIFKKSFSVAFAITTGILTFTPESVFNKIQVLRKVTSDWNAAVNRIILLLIVYMLSLISTFLYYRFRRSTSIKGRNYCIKVQYGNLLKIDVIKNFIFRKKCWRVISFDECFTTSIGTEKWQINEDSICGQYLKKHPISDMQQLIDRVGLAPSENKSKFQNNVCYASGSIIPREGVFLMAFAKLNQEGLGEISYKEYLECLNLLWNEIDNYYGQKDVYISVIGSGVTRMNDMELTTQELLDTIIYSYKLNRKKIKSPAELHIVCRKKDGVLLNDICA